MSVVATVAGWAGAGVVLVAYALLMSGRVSARDLLFVWLNLVGSVGLVLNGVEHAAWPSATLNIVWLVIGVFGFLRGPRRAEVAGTRSSARS
jgi:hypothetical protein